MPPDHGSRLDQHHGVEDLRPDSVKPHPEHPVGGEEPRVAGALPTQGGHLVSQSNEFELQRSAAAHPEREQGTDSGQKCDHAYDGMGTAQETLHMVGSFDFCAGTAFAVLIRYSAATGQTIGLTQLSVSLPSHALHPN
jgi:hypothetical protein